MAAFATGAVAPKPRPACPSHDDDLVVLTLEGAAYLVTDSEADRTQRSEPADTDDSCAYLAKLWADQTAHATALRALGRDPEDDGAYLLLGIAKLEARHRRQEQDDR